MLIYYYNVIMEVFLCCPCSLVPGSSCEFLTCCLDFLRLGSDFRAGVRIVRSAEVRCKFPDMGPEQVYGGVSE